MCEHKSVISITKYHYDGMRLSQKGWEGGLCVCGGGGGRGCGGPQAEGWEEVSDSYVPGRLCYKIGAAAGMERRAAQNLPRIWLKNTVVNIVYVHILILQGYVMFIGLDGFGKGLVSEVWVGVARLG